MQRAGAAVAERAAELAGGGTVTVLVGPGNNGGDGLVAAHILTSRGQRVRVFGFRRSDLSPFDGEAVALEDDPALQSLRRSIEDSRVVVDSLLGIGSSRPPDGLLADVLRTVNGRQTGKSLGFAVDIPTGVESDTGNVPTIAFRADISLAMGFAKVGNVVYPGAACGGALEVVDVGLSPELASEVLVSVPDPADIASALPSRGLDSNKGTHGRVLVVAGSHDFLGAPALSSLAAYRIGAGLVEVACDERVQTSVAMRVAEAVFTLYSAKDGKISPQAMSVVETAMARASSLVYGPGLGLSAETVATAGKALRLAAHARIPSVWDADGLNALAQLDEWWRADVSMVLTPHPGEMARLTGLSIREIQADRLGTARRFTERWGKTVVLKGAGTIVASPDGRAVVNPTGGPNLATAGTGDVLSGMIGGLLAQKASPWEAAVCGVYLHGLAGDMVREQLGDAGTVAGDLLPLIPRARLRIAAAKEVV
jgi:NAD(P)H-hydrate epimerase